MQDITPEQVLFQWYDSNFTDLWSARLVCKKWNNEIMKNPNIYKHLVEYQIYALLYYDKGVYDEHYVRRTIILRKITELNYDCELVPVLTLVDDDIDSTFLALPKMSTLINTQLPLEFQIFLKLYRDYPSDKVRVYTPDFMEACANGQSNVVRKAFIEYGIDEANKMITIHPLCYSKHYKGDISDTQYINVLCYLNIVGEYGIPSDNNRYFILILEMENLQDDESHKQLLIDQLKMITTNVYMNWDYLEDLDLQPFVSAVEILIKQQKFNL